MALSAARLIVNVAAPQKDGLLASFFSQRPGDARLYFRGDINALEVYGVKPFEGSSTQFWQPATITTSQLKVGIGDADQRPTGGTFALSYNASSTGLTVLAYNIAAATLQTALNANAQVIATGDTVVVTLLATGVYQVAWQAVGTRLLFGSDPALLLPDCNVFVSRSRTGSASVKEVQIIELIQRPYVYVSSWTATGAASATVTTIRVGDGSTKAMHQITLSPIPYEGTFTVQTTDGVSSAIPFDATAAVFQSALAGTWTVVKSGDANWTIQRSSVGASALVSGNVDVTGLRVFSGLLGTLTMNASALFARFLSESSNSFSTTLSAKYDDGTNRETILSVDVTLQKEILSDGTLAPSAWPGGFGDVSSNTTTTVDGEAALFSGTAGKTIKRLTGTGFLSALSGVMSASADKTITAGGTTGAQTINKIAGSVNFAAAATSLVVTNSLITTSSVIIATVATADSTMKTVVAVAASGSFTLTANASATAETRVNFIVIN